MASIRGRGLLAPIAAAFLRPLRPRQSHSGLDPIRQLQPLSFHLRKGQRAIHATPLLVTDGGAAMGQVQTDKAPSRPPSRPPSVAAPSSSVVVVSPQNEILLLHRVHTSRTFSSAQVFPGGNLSTFHEGALIPDVDSPERHVDGPAYRMAAIRETFEESGVLLARSRGQGQGQEQAAGSSPRLLHVPASVRSLGRKMVADNKVRFADWLDSVGGKADSQNLIPFTRWITPSNMARRFTTQMYLYLMPLMSGAGTGTRDQFSPQQQQAASDASEATADLAEVMAAEYASAATWVERARRNEIILFPPQVYILSLLAPILRGAAGLPAQAIGAPQQAACYAAERQTLQQLIQHGGEGRGGGRGREGGRGAAVVENQDQIRDPSNWVPWAEKVISPRLVAKLPNPDGRAVMALDRPGPELRASGRTGDADRVVLVGNLPPGPPRDIEVRLRQDVLDGAGRARL